MGFMSYLFYPWGLILQGLAIVHFIRRRPDTYWIWVILFHWVGALVYILVEVIPDVLRHRLVLTYDALADEISSEIVIQRVLQTVALPQVNAVPQQGHSVPPVMQGATVASGR